MKRLNKKGFTLIELLAVIVILAIVLVVTIPSVISAMNNAKHGQLQNAADAVAEWLNKQYELKKLEIETDENFSLWYEANDYVSGAGFPTNTFKNYLANGSGSDTCTAYAATGKCDFVYRNSSIFIYPWNSSPAYNQTGKASFVDTKGFDLLKAAGISDPENNIDSSVRNWVKINDNDRFCVVLCAKENGSFYVKDGENYAISSGCEEYMNELYSASLGFCTVSNS